MGAASLRPYEDSPFGGLCDLCVMKFNSEFEGTILVSHQERKVREEADSWIAIILRSSYG